MIRLVVVNTQREMYLGASVQIWEKLVQCGSRFLRSSHTAVHSRCEQNGGRR